MSFTDYTGAAAGSASPGSGSSSNQTGTDAGYWSLTKLRRCYTDYLFSKRQELDEQIDARRYYHGSQWTADQIRIMKRRTQPVMTFNRVGRKIDGVCGLIERLRQDPKAYARTPQHEQGADLATAALRYVLDEQDWKAKSPDAAQDGAIDGIGGIELEITDGDKGDKEVGFDTVDVQSFFYDPRSYKMNFSDARYMGIGKWLDDDIAKEMFPDAPIDAFSGNEYELINNSDREQRWFSTVGAQHRVRIVDIWYKHKGGWCWAIFSGNALLMEGKSYFQDEKGKDFCKYIMFSGNVDQDGDRYGFIRNMKSAQDGVNAKQSKMQHMIASKRLFITRSSVDDIEKTRAEYAKNDGVIVVNGTVNDSVKADDQTFDFAGLGKLLELNIAEIENFGPNPQLLGQADGAQSGRAIQLLQQAGMAELGPYIMAYRDWKIRVYRAIWNAIKKHWQAQRWIRVTDFEGQPQHVEINKLQMDPMTGQPSIVNAIGDLDVDIILDEGPDHVNGMADLYETISQVLPAIAPVNPAKAGALADVLIESSPIPADIKKKFKDQQQQMASQPPPPDPAVESARMLAQVKAEAAVADQQLKAQTAEADRQARMEEHALEMHVTRENAQQTLNINAEKANQELEIERAKARMALDLKGEESDHKRQQMTMDFDHKEGTTIDARAQDHFKNGIGQIIEAVSRPKKITIKRDGAGRILEAATQ